MVLSENLSENVSQRDGEGHMELMMLYLINKKMILNSTRANSGSSLGSTPNSYPPGTAPAPSSPTITGDEMRASERRGPG